MQRGWLWILGLRFNYSAFYSSRRIEDAPVLVVTHQKKSIFNLVIIMSGKPENVMEHLKTALVASSDQSWWWNSRQMISECGMGLINRYWEKTLSINSGIKGSKKVRRKEKKPWLFIVKGCCSSCPCNALKKREKINKNKCNLQQKVKSKNSQKDFCDFEDLLRTATRRFTKFSLSDPPD